MKGQLKPYVHPSPMGSEDTSSSWVYPTLPLSAQLSSSAQSLTVWEGGPLLPDQAHRILCAKFSSPGLPKHLMHMQKLCDHGSTGPGYQAQEGPGAKLPQLLRAPSLVVPPAHSPKGAATPALAAVRTCGPAQEPSSQFSRTCTGPKLSPPQSFTGETNKIVFV